MNEFCVQRIEPQNIQTLVILHELKKVCLKHFLKAKIVIIKLKFDILGAYICVCVCANTFIKI